MDLCINVLLQCLSRLTVKKRMRRALMYGDMISGRDDITAFCLIDDECGPATDHAEQPFRPFKKRSIRSPCPMKVFVHADYPGMEFSREF